MNDKTKDFDTLQKLGQGSFGVVYKVRRKKDGNIYVLKIIDLSRMGHRQKEESMREAILMNKLAHPYVVRFYDSFKANNKLHIVMEHCENKDLG